MAFRKAVVSQSRLRLALVGGPGTGKTFTALSVATALGERTALICSERGSAAKYAKRFAFDIETPAEFSVTTLLGLIRDVESAGYDTLIIDSFSAAWNGKGGLLEMKDMVAKRSKSGDDFGAWREVTPKQQLLVDAVLGARCHVICTMRSKVEYVIEKNEKGKNAPRKVGMAPVWRDGVEYEFDVIGDIDDSHTMVVSKTRCEALDGAVIERPGAEFAAVLKQWLTDGAPMAPEAPRAPEGEQRRPPPSAPKPANERVARQSGGSDTSTPASQETATGESSTSDPRKPRSPEEVLEGFTTAVRKAESIEDVRALYRHLGRAQDAGRVRLTKDQVLAAVATAQARERELSPPATPAPVEADDELDDLPDQRPDPMPALIGLRDRLVLCGTPAGLMRAWEEWRKANEGLDTKALANASLFFEHELSRLTEGREPTAEQVGAAKWFAQLDTKDGAA